jgi:hypothetical protein
LLDHVAIAVVRAAVLKGEIDGLKGYAIPCLLWLRVCEIEVHLNLEAKLREDGEAPSSQPLLAEDVAYSTAWVGAPPAPPVAHALSGPWIHPDTVSTCGGFFGSFGRA